MDHDRDRRICCRVELLRTACVSTAAAIMPTSGINVTILTDYYTGYIIILNTIMNSLIRSA